MARRTKSQRRKEKRAGYKHSPGVSTDPYNIWKKRPCNRGKNNTQFFISRLLGHSNCKYVSVNYMLDPKMCPEYDARYCPYSEDDDF